MLQTSEPFPGARRDTRPRVSVASLSENADTPGGVSQRCFAEKTEGFFDTIKAHLP